MLIRTRQNYFERNVMIDSSYIDFIAEIFYRGDAIFKARPARDISRLK